MSAIILYVTARADQTTVVWFDPGDEETVALERFMDIHDIKIWEYNEESMEARIENPKGEVYDVAFAYVDEPGMVFFTQ